MILIADGGRRSRLWGTYENHGEVAATSTKKYRCFDLRPTEFLAPLNDRLVVEWDNPRSWHRPRSTGFELVNDEEASPHRFLAYTFPSCSPGTARPVVPDRPDFVAAAPIHPRRSPGTDCRQLHPAAATTK